MPLRPRRSFCVLLTVATLALSACDQGGDARETAADSAAVERGRYLAEGLLLCVICHSERDWDRPGGPPVEGMAAAGRVWWDDEERGRLVAPNLTPDTETGIGRWTDEELVRSIRTGIGRDGRHLHLLAYSDALRHLADRDVEAVIAYLRSLEPIHNPLPETALPEAAQAGLASDRPAEPSPVDLTVDDPVQRGRALVMLGNCDGCHTAHRAPRRPPLFSGGNLIERDGRAAFSANITPHATGVPYDADAFIEVIRTGKQGTLSPLMPWVAYRKLSDRDLRAVHAFLQTQLPVEHRISNRGERSHCPVCDQRHGMGRLNPRPATQGIELDPTLHTRYQGAYRHPRRGITLDVTMGDDGLRIGFQGRRATRLIALSTSRFLAPGLTPRPLRFVLPDDGGPAERLIMENMEPDTLERVGTDR